MKTAIALLLTTIISFGSSMNSGQVSFDYYEGIEKAKESNKPIVVLFTSRICKNPIQINELIENDKEVKSKISDSFEFVILYVDDKTKLAKEEKVERDGRPITLRTKGDKWAHIELSKYKCNMQPVMLMINAEEEILKEPLIGKVKREDILEYLDF